MARLHNQFTDALTNIEVNGAKKDRAVAAHTEIQGLLSEDPQLSEWGVNTRLIGSYSRHTAIYPGKDVDVFGRLENLDSSAAPEEVYDQVEIVLVDAYGHVDEGGRASPQDRSVKVEFPDPDDPSDEAAFAVDAVPAVRAGSRWAIPSKDRNLWTDRTGRWVTTDPERFGELSSTLSTVTWSPVVGSQNAYKPIVKLMRQARRIHLGKRRPSGLYVEFAAYEVWNAGLVTGDEWDSLFAATLRHVAERFERAPNDPLLDPGLGAPVEPPLTPADWTNAANVFSRLADLSDEALNVDTCPAAVRWREILGENSRGEVFPLPPGCDAKGFPISSIAALAGTGSNEARRFG